MRGSDDHFRKGEDNSDEVFHLYQGKAKWFRSDIHRQHSPAVTDDRNCACTHGVKAKPEGSDKVRNCRCKSREHDAETSHT